MKKLTGAQILIESLMAEGVDTHLRLSWRRYSADLRRLLDSKIKHVLVRHEQGAAHMAEGYARVSGRPGVVIVTSGPGATNAVTGIADAYMDSTPIVVISGQVPTAYDRQRRLPGSRHRRNHAALHQAQLPGQGRQGPRANRQGSVLHRRQRTPRPGADRSAQRHPDPASMHSSIRTRSRCAATSRRFRAIRARSNARSKRSSRPRSRCSTSAAESSGLAPRPN